jgi:lysyl-tRNA synthetase class 2
VNTTAAEINEKFDKEKQNFQDVIIAGRIMTRRIMGNATFAVIQDSTERLQIYIRRDDICSGEDKTLYNTVFKKLLDLGDIIGVSGYMFTTQTGESTLHVTSLKVLCKSLRPLPVV